MAINPKKTKIILSIHNFYMTLVTHTQTTVEEGTPAVLAELIKSESFGNASSVSR